MVCRGLEARRSDDLADRQSQVSNQLSAAPCQRPLAGTLRGHPCLLTPLVTAYGPWSAWLERGRCLQEGTPRSGTAESPAKAGGLPQRFRAIDAELQLQQQAEEIARLQAALAAANPLAPEVRPTRSSAALPGQQVSTVDLDVEL